MKRKFSQWDKDAEYGSDILGVGVYSNLPPSGKPKKRLQIGFIRTRSKPAPIAKPRTGRNAKRK